MWQFVALMAGCGPTIVVPADDSLGVGTGWTVAQGEVLSATVEGTWSWCPDPDCLVTADGERTNGGGAEPCGNGGSKCELQSAPIGALIAVVGERAAEVGLGGTFECPGDGDLLLMMNDIIGTHDDNDGKVRVTLTEGGHEATGGMSPAEEAAIKEACDGAGNSCAACGNHQPADVREELPDQYCGSYLPFFEAACITGSSLPVDDVVAVLECYQTYWISASLAGTCDVDGAMFGLLDELDGACPAPDQGR